MSPSPSSDVRIEVDPAAPGTVLRILLVAECGINLVVAAVAALRPAPILAFFSPALAVDPPQAAVTLMQFTCVSTLAMTAQAAQGIPNTISGIESRRSTYWTYVAAEAMMLSFFHYYAALGEEAVGMKPSSMLYMAKQLYAPILLRLGVLLFRPHWFGRYKIVKNEKTK